MPRNSYTHKDGAHFPLIASLLFCMYGPLRCEGLLYVLYMYVYLPIEVKIFNYTNIERERKFFRDLVGFNLIQCPRDENGYSTYVV